MDNERFIVVGDDKHIVKKINPEVSYSKKGVHVKNYSKTNKPELEIKDMYWIMRVCASGHWKNIKKGARSMHSYRSEYKGLKPYEFDGAIFIDFDKFDTYPELRGFQHVIFERFADLCAVMNNLLCIKYSPSGNLHFIVYHNNINDANEYVKYAKIYTCALAKTIKKVLNVDFRDYDGVIDTSLYSPDQQLNLNDSPVKWNIACCGIKFKSEQMEILNAEYGEYLKHTYKIVDVAPTYISGNGETVVNNQFYIAGLKGYDARTAIAAAAYFHFKQDYEATENWLASNFKYTNEWRGQFKSLVSHNTIGYKYLRTVELLLFTLNNESTLIPDGKYLTDVVDIQALTNKYIYINAGTGDGKTELVKNIAKSTGSKIIILQMNKALRDGKKRGIEDITYENSVWEKSVPKDRIHTTIEGFNRNCKELDLSEYIVVIDESHLLQDYCIIDGKLPNILKLLDRIQFAKQIIFMSATPKSDQKLYNFDIYRFNRIKKQALRVNMHPLKYIGRGSKEATRYPEMIKIVKSTPGKHLIFSNKHQECWKKYGLEGTDYTWFHSKNINDEGVQAILKDNRLITDITLATIYLGVGVEIKNETDVHIWFDLNEGWDKAFIEQSIGRPRDAERVHLHLFYTDDADMKSGNLSDEEVETVENAFKSLVIDHEGVPTINLVAAKLTGIYDANFNTYESGKKIEILKLGQIANNKDYFTVYDIELLRKLPYHNFSIQIHEKHTLNTDGREKIERNEDQLKMHLFSRSDSWWYEWDRNDSKYEDILCNLVMYWQDKHNADKMLKDCRKVWKNGLELDTADNFFGSISIARDVMLDVRNYCDVQCGNKVIKDFSGSSKTEDEIKLSFKRVEKAFTAEYLNYITNRIIFHKPIRPERIEVTCDDSMCELLGLENIVLDDEKIPYPYKADSWKDVLKETKNTTNKINGAKGGAKKKTIKVRNVNTGEVLEFDSKTECMTYFGVASKQFSKFIKGEYTKKLSDFELIS